jgi:hypothetical protein
MWEFEDATNTGEKLLWASVLRRSVFDYVQYKGKGKFEMKWKRANRFLFGDEKEGDVSFDEVCAMFGWEPEYVRRVIKKLDRSDMKVIEPSRFKDDYKQYYDEPETSRHSRCTWECTKMAVMIMPWFLYSKHYREGLIPKPVKPDPIPLTSPLVCWQGA